jgi:transposase
MPQNFIACDRDQVLLMPPSLQDWLPEDHLAWTILDAVEEMNLKPLLAAYRPDGHGRPAYHPKVMVALLLYCYSRGNRSSRGIERSCRDDVACRVITSNRVPDHSTIAEFRRRHEAALAELFNDVLALCAQAGLVRVGVIALDGTKVQANASRFANLDYRQITQQILDEADRIDREEDERYGEKRGDELPIEVSKHKGRREWLRQAKRELEEKRAANPKQVPRSRQERLKESKRRLEEDLETERRANEAYEAWRAKGVSADGARRMAPGTVKPYQPPDTPEGKVNITDPDSREVKTVRWVIQGYNPQAVVSEDHVVLAAELSNRSSDFGHLEPMVNATRQQLTKIGITETPGVLLADAGYWHNDQMDNVTASGIRLLCPPEAATRKGTRPGWDSGRYAWMRAVLSGELGQELYRKRKVMVEPVFAHMKFNRRFDRFQRRGWAAAHSEWRLVTTSHNLLKLHQHRIAAQGP